MEKSSVAPASFQTPLLLHAITAEAIGCAGTGSYRTPGVGCRILPIVVVAFQLVAEPDLSGATKLSAV